MLCRDKHSYSIDSPYVLLKGIWFTKFGFTPGDQVIITNPEPHCLVMRIHKTADEMDKERAAALKNAKVKRP